MDNQTPTSDNIPPLARVAGRVRATANTVALVSAILLLIGWAMHWPVPYMARLGLLFVAAFIVSFIAILVENRTRPEPDPEEWA